MIVYTDQIIGILIGIFCAVIGFNIYNPFKNNIEQVNWFMRNKKLMKIVGVGLVFINVTLILAQKFK
jgi:hypothetical protein